MYKVFSGERLIVLTNKEIRIKGRNLQSSSEKNLSAVYSDFQKRRDDSLQIVSDDLEKLWKDFQSLFTVIEAAGGLVKNEKKEVLMIFRNNHWDLPKGKIEKDESMENAALREVEEECGIRGLKLVKPLAATHHTYSLHKKNIFKRTHWFEMICENCNELRPQTSEGITEARWVKQNELPSLIPLAYPSIREIISSVFSL